MSARACARWVLAVAVSLALLTAPALWNGFPLLQWDTGGYLARTYEATLVPSRSVVYGLILRAGVPLGLWPVVLLQSALTIWIMALMLRAHGLGRRPLLLLGMVATLSVLTTLPWLTAILLTDIFCGLGVLALYLLAMRADALSRSERVALVVFVAVSAATHSATFAVMLALLAAGALTWLIDRTRLPSCSLWRGSFALALGAVMVFAADYAVAKRLAWTPGGGSIAFGRMLQDGIVKKYLDTHCPDAKLRLCAVKDRIPQDADTWFWGSDLFDSMGRFAGLDQEMSAIALGSLIEYPGLQIKTAAIATVKQLLDVRTGEGVLEDLWHTRTIIERYTPRLTAAMRAAREQRGEITFATINRVHYPLALFAMALLPLFVAAGWRGLIAAELGELAATIALALLANAFVCGALSNPHDRYGARLVWLAGCTVALAIAQYGRQARDVSSSPYPVNQIAPSALT